MFEEGFINRLNLLNENNFFDNLEIKRGIEREALRVDTVGKISQKSHPKKLGSALCNPHITTDFAEALIELVTPKFNDVDNLYAFLEQIHAFARKNLENEMFWNASMPCKFNNESEIKLAEYGGSNLGKLKNIYRRGLKQRYGPIMQCISGIHYNFSLTTNSWNSFLNTSNVSQGDIDNCYMNLVRNVKRNYWFIAFNFGGSPRFHKSFIDKRELGEDRVDRRFHGLQNACSLRMSDVGYQSKLQQNIKVNYNSLNKYVESIIGAINMPNKVFKKINELDNDGYPQQISSGTLQIENELYDVIRPKRRGKSGERPANLLKNHGIEYVEFRGLDINPFEITGISKAQIHFMDIFLMYCLITPSPKILPEEAQIIAKNSIVAIEEGRNKNAEIFFEGEIHKITDAVDIIFSRLALVAKELGSESAESLDTYIHNKKKGQTLPEIIIKDLHDSKKDFHEYNLDNSLDIAKEEIKLDDHLQRKFEEQAYQSIKEQETLETENKIDIISFINDFNSKLK